MWILYSVSSLCLCCPSFLLSCFSFFLPLEIWMKAPPVATVALHGVHCNIQIPFQCSADKLFINLLCVTPFLLLYSVQIYSLFHSITTTFLLSPHNTTCRTLPTNHPLLRAVCSKCWYQLWLQFPLLLFFFGSLRPLCLHSAFSFCTNNMFSQSANKI